MGKCIIVTWKFSATTKVSNYCDTVGFSVLTIGASENDRNSHTLDLFTLEILYWWKQPMDLDKAGAGVSANATTEGDGRDGGHTS